MKPAGMLKRQGNSTEGKKKKSEQIADRIIPKLNISEVAGNTTLKMYLGLQSFFFNSRIFSYVMKNVSCGVNSTLGIQSFCIDIKENHEAKEEGRRQFLQKWNKALTLLEKAFQEYYYFPSCLFTLALSCRQC